jgi:hypothetical protein
VEVASLPTARGADAAIYDEARKLAFIGGRAHALQNSFEVLVIAP